MARGWRSVWVLLVAGVMVLGNEATLIRGAKGEAGEDGVMVKLKSGLKMAGKLLGFDAAAGVAQLVAQAFGGAGAVTPPPVDEPGAGPLAAFLRLLTLDSPRVGAVVVNVLVFLAQLITSALVPRIDPEENANRKLREGSPVDWIINNPSQSLQAMIAASKDKDLPYKIIANLKEKSSDSDISCVQLLVCKTAPFVWGMQRALATLTAKIENGTQRDENQDGGNALFRHLPGLEEFLENGDTCERKFEECRLMD